LCEFFFCTNIFADPKSPTSPPLFSQCIDFTNDGKIALVGVNKKLLVLQVDGSGVATDTRVLPGDIKDVKVNEFCGSTLAVCALKNGDLTMYDLSFPNEKGLLYSLECGSSCLHAAVSDEIMVVGGADGKITIRWLNPPNLLTSSGKPCFDTARTSSCNLAVLMTMQTVVVARTKK
jgi:hypothetical protein